jgi:hypothetical protein
MVKVVDEVIMLPLLGVEHARRTLVQRKTNIMEGGANFQPPNTSHWP